MASAATEHIGSTPADPVSHAVGFVQALRLAGLSVPVGATASLVDALHAVGVSSGEHVYWAARATLVTRREDVEVFDRVFRAWWWRDGSALLNRSTEPETITLATDDSDDGDAPPSDDTDDNDPMLSVRFSSVETLVDKDFAQCSDDELADLYALMAQLRLTGPFRSSRRLTSSKRRGGHPDIRKTVRAAMRAGGEPISWHTRERGTRPRRVVLLLDVSGSMEAYARALVRFLHAAVVGRHRVEAFALGTRLTRITRELSSRDPDRALAAAGDVVHDWSGGTRLGDGIATFNDRWGVRGMARGAVVVILSDGWDRGEPEVMAQQMERLARVAHSIVWVNPLKASPGYAPLAQGMAAALPHVDRFVEGHSLNSLVALAEAIGEA